MEKNQINNSTGEIKKIKRLSIIPGESFDTPVNKEIIVWKEVKEIEKTGDGKSDFIIHCKLVPAEKYNRADRINSYSGDVGIQNILRKVALGGESVASVVDSGKFQSKQKGDHVVDMSKTPKDTFDALGEVEKGMKEYQKLPFELKKGRKMADFAKEFNADELNNYIEAQVQKRLAAQKNKEPVKEGE